MATKKTVQNTLITQCLEKFSFQIGKAYIWLEKKFKEHIAVPSTIANFFNNLEASFYITRLFLLIFWGLKNCFI